MNAAPEQRIMNTLDAGSMPGTDPVESLDPTQETMTATGDKGMTLNIFSENGLRIEFYQEHLSDIENTLGLLIQPRLFTQPLLAITSHYNVTTIPSRTIDLIRVQCSATFPLVMPAGILKIEEVGSETVASEPGPTEKDGESSPELVTEFVEIHTMGGWVVFLKLEVVTTGPILDRRQNLLHLYDLPMLPFYCFTGGMGFINPAKICRMTICPGFEGPPANSLPAGLLRWESSWQRKDSC
jgi:hypothetical protein